VLLGAELVDEAGQGFHGVQRQREQLQGDGLQAVGGADGVADGLQASMASTAGASTPQTWFISPTSMNSSL